MKAHLPYQQLEEKVKWNGKTDLFEQIMPIKKYLLSWTNSCCNPEDE